MAFAGDDLVLQLLADGGEVGVVAGDAHQQVAVILGVLLRIAQHVGVEHVDLQGGAAVLDVAAQERLELVAVLRVAQHGRVEGDRVAAAVGQHVEIISPVAFAVRRPAAQHLAHRVDVGRRSVDVRAVGGADGVGEELALGAPVRAGRQDVRIGDPVVPAQHPRAELAAGC